MQVVIVYESSFGSTRRVAEAVGHGLRQGGATAVDVLPTGAVTGDDLAVADLLVVGGPTHLGTLSTVGSRAAARAVVRVDRPARGASSDDAVIDLVTETDLPTVGPGLRRWFHRLPSSHGKVAAAFDTRLAGERGAAGVIARRLGRHGYRVVAAEGFVVEDVTAPIGPDEVARAGRWGVDLAHQVTSAVPH